MRALGLTLILAIAAFGCGDDNGGPVAGSGGSGGGSAGAGGTAGAGGSAGAGGEGGSAGMGGEGGTGGMLGTPMMGTIPIVCRNSFTQQLSALPFELTVATTPLTADGTFTAEATPTLNFSEEFLNAALEVLTMLMSVDAALVQGTVDIAGDATSDGEQTAVLDGTPCEVAFGNPNGCPTFTLPLADPPTDPPTVTGPLGVDLATVTLTGTAGGTGTQVCFDAFGTVPDMLTPGDDATDTFLSIVAAGAIPVLLACAPGTLNDNGTPEDDTDDFIDPNIVDDLICFDVP